MTNDMPNAPIVERPPTSSMFQTWLDAVTKPNEGTYVSIASSPNAKMSTAFLWVFIGSLIQSFLSFLVENQALRQLMQQAGVGDQVPVQGFGGRLATLICGAPITAVISVIFFAIGTGLIYWIARMFGGRATYDQMAYVFAAIAAPVAVVSGLLSLLGAIPVVGLCFGSLAFLVALYVIVLEIMATKAVNGFGYGQAAGSVLIPAAVVFLVVCCLVVGLIALLAPTAGSIFSSLGPMPFPTP